MQIPYPFKYLQRLIKRSNQNEKGINHSAAVVSILTIFCRLLGFVRDTIIAKYLGAGDIADAFFASFKLSNLFRKIFGEGALFSGFVPVFTKLHQQDKDSAILFSSKLFTIITISLLVIVGFGELFMDKIILLVCPGFAGEKLANAIKISQITFPYFFFITSCSILWGVLNSVGIFFYYGFVPAVLSIVMIFFGLVLKNNFEHISICFSYSVLIGGFLQLTLSYVGCFTNGFKIKITFAKNMFDGNIRKVFKKIFNTTISTSLTQINTIIDGILASFIASGVSYLYYADRIFYFPFSIVGVTLSIVSLPAISSAVENGDVEKNKSLQTLATKLVLLYGIPAALSMLFAGKALVYSIFEYGDFTSQDTIAVGKIVAIFACGLFFALANRVMSVIFFANLDTKTPMKITILGVFVNIIASSSLIFVFGIYGIALGTCVSYIVSGLLMFVILKKRSLLLLDHSITNFAIKTFCGSLIIGLFCLIFCKFLPTFNGGLAFRITLLCLFGLFCGVFYIAFLRLLKINLIKITFGKAS